MVYARIRVKEHTNLGGLPDRYPPCEVLHIHRLREVYMRTSQLLRVPGRSPIDFSPIDILSVTSNQRRGGVISSARRRMRRRFERGWGDVYLTSSSPPLACIALFSRCAWSFSSIRLRRLSRASSSLCGSGLGRKTRFPCWLLLPSNSPVGELERWCCWTGELPKRNGLPGLEGEVGGAKFMDCIGVWKDSWG